ncbi:hypothetical protein [Lignipirellula cremea]|nr:hypothetical protein [Lignipirellula cremea]
MLARKLAVILLLLLASWGDCAESVCEVSGVSRGKGKDYQCVFSLKLTNHRDHPAWFLLSSANEVLSFNGEFPSFARGDLEALYVFEYDTAIDRTTRNGKLFLLSYHGKGAGCSFRALLLPAKSWLTLANFASASTIGPPRFFDVWEVRTLRVNGDIAMNDFLQFNVQSTPDSIAKSHLAGGRTKAVPREVAIANIRAEVLRREIVVLPLPDVRNEGK